MQLHLVVVKISANLGERPHAKTLKAFVDTLLLAQPNKETTKAFNNRTIPLFIENVG
jgi:hypothetical protein